MELPTLDPNIIQSYDSSTRLVMRLFSYPRLRLMKEDVDISTHTPPSFQSWLSSLQISQISHMTRVISVRRSPKVSLRL